MTPRAAGHLAAGITSLMTGTAYRRSAELAAAVGPYEGYSRNASAHTRVMRKHAAANDAVRPIGPDDARLLALAAKQWHQGLRMGERSGWRNAQASVLAPTGTIGLMMDCDTTGIEPDLALVKVKKLVGGASMQIVNHTVPRALTVARLHRRDQRGDRRAHQGARPRRRCSRPSPEHYDVFDCALGERSIGPMGHVRMMAAAQPFLSGAISKTVNMPASATVEEVENIYFQGWKLGLKALAIYRDNCKVGQPLSDLAGQPGRMTRRERIASASAHVESRPVRKRLPKKRPSQTISFSVGGAEGYLTAGSYPDNGLGEVFIKMSKQGSTLAGVMDAFSVAVSIALQYGVPLDAYVSKFINMRFDPAGLTDDPDVRLAQSVMDYLFRRLALDYLPYERRAELGIFTAEERAAQTAATYGRRGGRAAPDSRSGGPRSTSRCTRLPRRESARSRGTRLAHRRRSDRYPDGRRCSALLHLRITMRAAGSCYVCEQCGSTSGCS